MEEAQAIPSAPAPQVPPSTPKRSSLSGWILSFIILAVLLGVGYLAATYLMPKPVIPDGKVAVRVTDENGLTSYQTLSLPDAVFEGVSEETGDALHVQRPARVTLDDGTTISLAADGIVRGGGDSKSTLVAAVVPPDRFTLLAVWKNGAKIAWVNPADHSVQVFESNGRGMYVPVFLGGKLLANSLTFSEDGSALVVAKLSPEGTDMYFVRFSEGALEEYKHFPETITLVNYSPYAK